MEIEDRIRQEVDRLGHELSNALSVRLKVVTDQIVAAVAEQRATAEAEAMARFADDLANTREEAERTTQAAIAQARAEAEHARQAAVDEARADVERRVAADLGRTKADADAARAETGRLQAEVDRLRAEAARLGHENAAASRQREEAQREREAAQREKEMADREREAAHRAAAVEVERRTAEREATLAGLERLALTFRRIDASSALTDVLAALADAAASETARVAIFVAAPATPGSPPRFKPWRLHGFASAPENFDLGLTSARELARTGLPFAPLRPPRAGVAIPIDVGGQTVAMVYADAGEAEHPGPAGWPEAIELLARHAAARIETVTAVRTAQVLGARTAGIGGNDQSARRYAKLLVSEIKMYNEASVRQGRAQRDLYDRLRSEIERARRLFEERVPALGGARQAFDDELVNTLADGDAAALGIAPARKPA